MSPRQRVATTFSRRQPDRVPKHATFTPFVRDLVRRKTGCDDPADHFGFEMRSVGCNPPAAPPDFSRYLPPLPPGATVGEWGLAEVPGSLYHFNEYVYPLARMEEAAELDDYPFPDYVDPRRWAGIPERVAALHARGLFVLGSVGHIFETAWYMRSMERLFEDWALNPEFAERLLDRITELRCVQAARLVAAGADGISLGDDVGTQQKMMLRPETWRTWLKPRLARLIRAGKDVNPRLFVTYHSDGQIWPIIPDLIEVGVDVLNPVQPECMDPAEVKRQFGRDLAFWGTMGIQTTMPFGTPDEVRRVVRQRIESVGERGGLLLAPTHVLEPEVPWENILAFFEAVEQYGRYE